MNQATTDSPEYALPLSSDASAGVEQSCDDVSSTMNHLSLRVVLDAEDETGTKVAANGGGSVSCGTSPQLNYQGFQALPRTRKASRRISLTDSSVNTSNSVLLVLVGLPARGKSYIAKKLCRYLNWRGHTAIIFNVGAKRREKWTPVQNAAHFFDPSDTHNAKRRDSLAMEVLDEALIWLQTRQGQVAIFDATNSTKRRRRLLMERTQNMGVTLLFIESVCDDEKVLERNMLTKVDGSPDYADVSREEALKDLKLRIAQYEKAYEPMDDDEKLSYIKVINLRSKLVCNLVRGSLSLTIAFFLMHQHTDRRTVWLVRSGHSSLIDFSGSKYYDDYRKKESPLSLAGVSFARRLADLASEKLAVRSKDAIANPQANKFLIWTSTMLRARQTAQFLPANDCIAFASLNMMDLGIYDGWTDTKIAREAPDVFQAWQKDKLNYRFPGGESYADVLRRLDHFILDVESQTKPIIIISHLSCLRHLYSYFSSSGNELSDEMLSPYSVIQFKPSPYGWVESIYDLSGTDPQQPTTLRKVASSAV